MSNLRRVLPAVLILLFMFSGSLLSESIQKKKLDIDDIKHWRTHKASLSDNGLWYTVLYKLREKPESDKKEKSSEKESDKKKSEKKPSIYGKDCKTDVLYIRSTRSSKEYKIDKASKPLFSRDSNWIAYTIKDGEKKKKKKIIELRNLTTGKTWSWESDASYKFHKGADYFLTSDKKSFLLFNLKTRKEHFIGNTSEQIYAENSRLIIYTIESEDKRGNGIYAYNLDTLTTRSLDTGSYTYSDIAWNSNRTAVAGFKYRVQEKKDPEDISIITVKNFTNPVVKEYSYKKLKMVPDGMVPAVKNGRKHKIIWSNDNSRIFFSLTEKVEDKKEKGSKKEDKKDRPTVNVWHWKDKKLVSQQMYESDKIKKKKYHAMLLTGSGKVVQITGKEMQKLYISKGTDRWAAGTDNREWISDWDTTRNDLYRVDLVNGKRKLIMKGSYSRINISPDGTGLLIWDKGHHWYYNFKSSNRINISKKTKVSFTKREHDYYGVKPSYGFVGWTKDRKSVVVNHKMDLWLLPLDGKSAGINLTKSKGNIRFRVQDTGFRWKDKISERYLDMKSSLLLTAFNIENKYAGFYSLKNRKLKKLLFKPASFSASRWRQASVIKARKASSLIYQMGDYKNYPESYISTAEFRKSRRISKTNPQQKNYKWGHRILVNYKNDDGVALKGILSIPDDYKKGERRPMVVVSYEKLSDNLYKYAFPSISGAMIAEMQYISEGYLVLQPDIHFNVGTPHSDMLECINSAIKRVVELGYADSEKIGYQGFSFGGHAGMYMSTQKNYFAAIAAGAGVSNLTQGFNIDIVRDGSNEQDYYMIGQGRLGASPVEKPEMFIKESAVYSADKMETPLLLYHGTADKVVLWEHSFGFYSILRFLKKPVILLSYRGEGHGMRKKPNRLDVQIKLKEFFDHYLKGAEAAEWIERGIPYKPEKPSGKKDKKKRRTVPKWM